LKKKKGVGFAIVYPDPTLRPLREMFHATGATKTQRSQRFFKTAPDGYRE
jgi:hypothetical protein